MKYLLVIVALSGLVLCNAEEMDKYCTSKSEPNCQSVAADRSQMCCESSKVAGFERDDLVLSKKLTDYAWNQIVASYDHLLLSINFDTYTKDRPGLEKLYRGLSDTAWNKAIDLIKYVTKRGGKLHEQWDISSKNTTLHYIEPTETDTSREIIPKPVKIGTSVSELLSIEEAIRVEKALSKSAYAIHNEVQSHHKLAKKNLDAGVAHYIEEEFIEYQADTIRKLVGYHNDLRTILAGEYQCTKDKNVQLACYLFDEYLQKQ